MSYKAKVFKVIIASPGDVPKERLIIQDVIHEWDAIHSEKEDIVLLPVGWESHSSPTMGERPQAIINKQVLANCDLLIAVFWTRLGTPTGKAASGTVEEIEEHLKAGKPAMIYFSSQAVVPESIDQKQYQALLKFREELGTRGLYETYASLPEFKEKLSRQLAQTVIRHFAPKKNGQRTPENGRVHEPPAMPRLSDKAKLLLAEAAEDPEGIVLRMRSRFGLSIQTNGMNLVKRGLSRKLEAEWESALRLLQDTGLLQDRGNQGEYFSPTDEGYRVASLLSKNELDAALT